MGANDAAEMLEVAKDECGRLEADVLLLLDKLTRARAERDKALAERDASRQVNAEFLAAAHAAELAAQDKHFAATPMNGDDGGDS